MTTKKITKTQAEKLWNELANGLTRVEEARGLAPA